MADNWIEPMKQIEAVRLFTSLYVRKGRKGELASAQEVDAMFRIALSQEPLTPLQLSRKMGVSKTIVSRLIDRLAAKDFVAKLYDLEDKRSYRLTITAGGKEELDAMYRYYAEPLARLEAKLGKDAFCRLMALIERANELD